MISICEISRIDSIYSLWFICHIKKVWASHLNICTCLFCKKFHWKKICGDRNLGAIECNHCMFDIFAFSYIICDPDSYSQLAENKKVFETRSTTVLQRKRLQQVVMKMLLGCNFFNVLVSKMWRNFLVLQIRCTKKNHQIYRKCMENKVFSWKSVLYNKKKLSVFRSCQYIKMHFFRSKILNKRQYLNDFLTKWSKCHKMSNVFH